MTFEAFLKQRDEVASAYVCGDAEPLERIATRHNPASFFGPAGGALEGSRKVVERYEKDAGSFEPGGESHLEILHSHSSGDLGYWVGLQKATAQMKGKSIPMTLRVTELFRKEEGEWKLIHRHADMQSE